jgi:hypothetical protein
MRGRRLFSGEPQLLLGWIMRNPKTAPSSHKPEIRSGWVRKCDLDAWLDRYLPVPTQVISNEEYTPIAQTPEQRRLEQELIAQAETHARRLGMDRRTFLRSSCGMALAFAAMNSVFGHFFRVDAVELTEPAAVAENNPTTLFSTCRRITWPCPARLLTPTKSFCVSCSH